MDKTIARRMAGGAAWMLLFKLLERSIGLVSTLILVRLLMPADFGIVAMAMSFIVMAELLAAFGFDVALIQNQGASEHHYHSAWTCNLLLGTAVAALMLLAAAPVAGFYGRAELYGVVCALAAGPMIAGAENIGVVAFRKELDFRSEFLFQLGRKLAGFIVVVPLAFWWESYWALVCGMLSAKLAGTVLSYIVHPFRPRLSLREARSLFSFSKWLLLTNVLVFLKERASDFIIGRLHGASTLGIYNVGYEIAHLPTSELSGPINRALIPGFARLAANLESVRSVYRSTTEVLALLSIPMAAGLYAAAPLLVPVVLGDRWLATVPLIEVLTLNGLLWVLQSQVSGTLYSIGQPAAVTWLNLGYVVGLLPLMAWQVHQHGALGAAHAVLAMTSLAMPVYLLVLRRGLDIPMSWFLHAVHRPLAAAGLMMLAMRWWLPPAAENLRGLPALASLLLLLLLGALVYLGSIGALWLVAGRPAGAEHWLVQRLRAALASRRVA